MAKAVFIKLNSKYNELKPVDFLLLVRSFGVGILNFMLTGFNEPHVRVNLEFESKKLFQTTKTAK